jgi:hypothetical protein
MGGGLVGAVVVVEGKKKEGMGGERRKGER